MNRTRTAIYANFLALPRWAHPVCPAAQDAMAERLLTLEEITICDVRRRLDFGPKTERAADVTNVIALLAMAILRLLFWRMRTRARAARAILKTLRAAAEPASISQRFVMSIAPFVLEQINE